MLIVPGMISSAAGTQGQKKAKDDHTLVGVTCDGSETGYDDLYQALLNAMRKKNPVLTLYKDIDYPYMMWLSDDLAGMTLDLNGHQLRRTGADKSKNGGIFGLSSGADLTVIDSAGEGGALMNGSSNNTSGGIHVEKGAKFTMQGGSISGINNKYYGAAIYNDGGTVDISGVNIHHNASEKDGGAIYHKEGYMYIRDCTIADNCTEKDGGGIAVNGWNVEIYNCKILRNFADGDGGGIWVNENRVFLVGGEIKANMADYGGGVYVDSLRDINIQGRLIIEDNKTTSNASSNLVLQDGNFSDATAYDGGLLPGSRIGINKTKSLNGGFKSVVGVTDYELANGYFFADRGKVELRNTSEKQEVFMATAMTDFGWGFVPFAAMAMTAIIMVIYLRMKQKKVQTKK